MVRLHTRVKRSLRLTTSRKHRFRNITKKNGAKTFLTEDKAKEYAESQKIENYSIESAKKGKRFKIVSQ